MKSTILNGKVFIKGVAEGQVLASTVALSFWGGVDPETGIIIDHHHPLHGSSITGKVFVIPSGCGSCTGSGTYLLRGAGSSVLGASPYERLCLD